MANAQAPDFQEVADAFDALNAQMQLPPQIEPAVYQAAALGQLTQMAQQQTAEIGQLTQTAQQQAAAIGQLTQMAQQQAAAIGQLAQTVQQQGQTVQQQGQQLGQQIQGVHQAVAQAEENSLTRALNSQGAPDSVLRWLPLPGGGLPANPPATQTEVIDAPPGTIDQLLQQYGLIVPGNNPMDRKRALMAHLGKLV